MSWGFAPKLVAISRSFSPNCAGVTRSTRQCTERVALCASRRPRSERRKESATRERTSATRMTTGRSVFLINLPFLVLRAKGVVLPQACPLESANFRPVILNAASLGVKERGNRRAGAPHKKERGGDQNSSKSTPRPTMHQAYLIFRHDTGLPLAKGRE